MKAEQQPWTIHLHAKAKNLDFKFKATRSLPACCNFFHFSLLLKTSPLFIRVTSGNHPTSRRKSLRSKITGLVDKFRSRPTKRKAVAVHTPSRIKRLRWVSCEGPISGSSVMIGNLALLIQSIFQKDTKGIIIHCLSILLCILAQLKKFIGTNANKLLLVSILAMVGYPVWLHMKNCLGNDKNAYSRYVRKSWNGVASTGFLQAVAQGLVCRMENP